MCPKFYGDQEKYVIVWQVSLKDFKFILHISVILANL